MSGTKEELRPDSCRYNNGVRCSQWKREPEKCARCGWRDGRGRRKDLSTRPVASLEMTGREAVAKEESQGVGIPEELGDVEEQGAKRNPRDLRGQRFGRLLVLERAEVSRSASGRHKGYSWRCRCDCGAECVVLGQNLKQGDTRSCGCMRRGRKEKACIS